MELNYQNSQSNQIQVPLNTDKALVSLFKELDDLKKKVSSLENKTVVEELKLPQEDLVALGIIKKEDVRRIRRGKGARPLMESEIKDAQEHCNNAMECSRYLHVGYNCYKKWAKFYGIFKTNPWGKGARKKYWAPDKGKYPLNQLLEGLFPDYPIYRLKDKIIRSGIKKAKCENCGFNEHRITDGKMPLLINFKDGNEKNHILENIQVLCYNCMFLIGKGYIRRGKVEFTFLDPDRMQGAPKKIESRF